MMLWGWVEKKIKNLLGGSLTADLPWEGEGVPLPVVSPDTRQKHTQSPFVYVMNVTHIHETHRSSNRSSNRSSKTYILIVKYT